MSIDLNQLSYPDAPKIVVSPPGPKSRMMFEKVQNFVPEKVYGAIESPVRQLVWESAKGSTVRDVDGNIFIDFTAGFHAASTGHSHPRVVKAITDAAALMMNTANWSFELRYEAAKKLLSICPPKLNRVFFGSSGSEATLGAVNAATAFKKKNDIIALYTHYHGQPGWYGKNINTLLAPSCNCYHCSFQMEYPDCGIYCAHFIEDVIKHQSRDNTAAIILEPWARYHGTPKGYLSTLRKVCDDNDILMIADEITSGMGRTGKWWMCDWENVTPDILCIAKGATSGFPMSAVAAPEEIIDSLRPGSQVHSFAGNPMSCAALSTTIDVIKDLSLVENANLVGDAIKKRLLEMKSEHEILGEIQCKGLEIGLTIVKDKKSREPDKEKTNEVFLKWLQKGVMNYGHSWTTPPLTLTKEQAVKAMDLLEESIIQTT